MIVSGRVNERYELVSNSEDLKGTLSRSSIRQNGRRSSILPGESKTYGVVFMRAHRL
jgi:hypothetical protein